MKPSRSFNKRYCTVACQPLKLLLGVYLLASAAGAFAQQQPPPGEAALRAELTGLLQSGSVDQAVRRAQDALQAAPQSAAVRHEYVNLHLALAREWLAERRFDDCLTALEAVLAVEPAHAEAVELRREILGARAQAGQRAGEVQRLLRLELYDAALERIREISSLRPDLSAALASSELAAWLGAADDHYLVQNFNEAFALYEHVLAANRAAAPDIRSRWALSLGLALAESDLSRPIDADAVDRLLARAADVLGDGREPVVQRIVVGLSAETAGQVLDAGRSYAQALGRAWELPPADQRRAAVERLRLDAGDRLRTMYAATRTQRRSGAWLMALPDVWKQRRTAHFDVYARNDLIAERVAEAAEFHFAGIRNWLGVSAERTWQPRCELRVHASAVELQQAAGTDGKTRAVSRTRVQGDRVLLRRMDLLQGDPLLLSSTLPNELTHLLLTDAYRDVELPLVLVEGLALQAEPPARRLLFRRLLRQVAPDPDALLTTGRLPDENELQFYAQADALTSWLLHQMGRRVQADSVAREPRLTQPGHPTSQPIAGVIETFRGGRTVGWWEAFGWESEDAMRSAWAAWHAARRNPPRMPLMILAGQSPESGEPGG
jgi:tetratricopeptide (TPR) repeat protein